jgi:putative membrane protein
MMSQIASKKPEDKYKKAIVILSITIPLAVAVLFGVNLRQLGFNVEPLTFLPPIYATINGLTAFALIGAVMTIKQGNRKAHEIIMKFAILLSVAFLVLYVAYHMTSDSTIYGDLNHDGILQASESANLGFSKYVYYFILITHIILSIGIIPLVLITFVRALVGKFEDHKKMARIAFPLWLYVALTGVVVYFMISPFYA